MEYVFSSSYSISKWLCGFADSCAAFGRHLHDHVVPNHRNNYRPHALGNRSLALFSVLLVSVKVFSITALSLGQVYPAESAALSSHSIIQLTNQSRAGFGLAQLRESGALAKAAQAKAEDMLERGYFAHNSPDGKTPWDFIKAAEYSYITAGENLAVNFTQAESVSEAWMKSPSHRANITNKHFEEIGIGIASGVYKGNPATFVVQMFGAPAGQGIVASNEPTVVEGAGNILDKFEVIGSESESKSELLSIREVNTEIVADNLVVTAHVTGPATKVLLRAGSFGVMFNPKPGGNWQAVVPLQKLVSREGGVLVKAVGAGGEELQHRLASFASRLESAFTIKTAQAASGEAGFSGPKLGINAFEQKFYPFFLAGLLSALVLAIGIKRHIQHVDLIANTSFVALLATFLWVM